MMRTHLEFRSGAFPRESGEEEAVNPGRRLLRYCEQILGILKIENSNELFNVWRYGFPYGWFRGFGE
jgi:hypothetical protein